jgi:flagellar biosynthetic protein FliQ
MFFTTTLLIDLMKDTLAMVLLLCAPVLIVATTVGVVITLIQAVTSLQESTLTFVPKVAACIGVLIFTAPWMVETLINHTTQMFSLMLEIAQHAGGRGG